MVLQPLTSRLCLVAISCVGPTHARVGTLDLLMADVPDLVRVAVAGPIARYNTEHSSLSAVSMAQAVPNLCVN